jgi:Trypsin
VAPVRLPGPGDAAAWAPGAQASAAGWGQLEAGLTPGGTEYYADRLREVQLPLIGDDACERVYGAGNGSLDYRPQWNACAGGAGAGTCYGDSGGPLAVATASGWLQVGITETGDACAAQGFFDIFTRADRVAAFARRANLTIQPYPTAPPRVVGRLVAGTRVSCAHGRWANRPSSYGVRWLEVETQDPKLVGYGDRHRVSTADVDHGLACEVTAGNAGGYDTAFSRPRT